ncbi:MAG: RNA 2'-phosphotransferase [Planctomycetales bacterium]|nr:RNA 2'-phosphotransferase [Planctomycetales bacterium]
MDKALVKASKFLSLLLRHQPDTVGLILDDQGWVDVDELLEKVNAAGRRWDLELLQQVVATNDKRRFRFSDDGKRIRANQGHSVDVDLQLEPAEPPELLFHGTAQRNLQSILRAGLDKRRRKHVHLSSDRMTAHKVGSRHGSPIVLAIASARMYADGLIFFLSDNQVWLTDSVPPEYISY